MARVNTGLGGPLGYGETAVPRGDDDSLRIDARQIFREGLLYFGNRFAGNEIFINTNGSLSFGQGFAPYPEPGGILPATDMIGVFWADVDTRVDGEGPESGRIWYDLDATGGRLTVTWENVGPYRRDAEKSNLFQLELTDRGGGDFDAVMRYERIEWTVGSAEDDAGARPVLAAERMARPLSIGDDAGALATSPGNTGTPGLWLYEIRGGTTAGADAVAGMALSADAGGALLDGSPADDILRGGPGDDILRGGEGGDWLYGGDGADRLNGGGGDDFIFGGVTSADLRDVVYAGAGADSVDAGYGNDLVYGGEGDDSIAGGFGVDELIGQGGDDVITGSAWSDLIFGGTGNDFLNGGFGFDRVNGGPGADRFYHLGIADHGSDWLQDYDASQGDRLFWGGERTGAGNFQINFADTPEAGAAGVSEAFVIYRPTGQIIWALVDGAGQDAINLQIGSAIFDLLA